MRRKRKSARTKRSLFRYSHHTGASALGIGWFEQLVSAEHFAANTDEGTSCPNHEVFGLPDDTSIELKGLCRTCWSLDWIVLGLIFQSNISEESP